MPLGEFVAPADRRGHPRRVPHPALFRVRFFPWKTESLLRGRELLSSSVSSAPFVVKFLRDSPNLST